MKRFDPSPFLPLTPRCSVLVALADGEKHGYAVIKEVARRTKWPCGCAPRRSIR
jgi:hypothetical protein